jgi:hypothetical protein
MWEPRHLTTLWPSAACYRNSFPFTSETLVPIYKTTRHHILENRKHYYILPVLLLVDAACTFWDAIADWGVNCWDRHSTLRFVGYFGPRVCKTKEIYSEFRIVILNICISALCIMFYYLKFLHHLLRYLGQRFPHSTCHTQCYCFFAVNLSLRSPASYICLIFLHSRITVLP